LGHFPSCNFLRNGFVDLDKNDKNISKSKLSTTESNFR
jgi:hypothetical protein